MGGRVQEELEEEVEGGYDLHTLYTCIKIVKNKREICQSHMNICSFNKYFLYVY